MPRTNRGVPPDQGGWPVTGGLMPLTPSPGGRHSKEGVRTIDWDDDPRAFYSLPRLCQGAVSAAEFSRAGGEI